MWTEGHRDGDCEMMVMGADTSRKRDAGTLSHVSWTSQYPASVSLAFWLKQAEHLHMTPRPQQNPTAGAVRAAKAIEGQESHVTSLPELIDRETGVQEILEILESIIAQAGDLIESRNPELVAEARAALKRYSGQTANTSSE
jgi:hypothetical protein